MSPKLVFFLTIILVLCFPFSGNAQQKKTGGAQYLQNISSPNGLEEIVTETEDKKEETSYQIQQDNNNSNEIIQTGVEDKKENNTNQEQREPSVVRIKL